MSFFFTGAATARPEGQVAREVVLLHLPGTYVPQDDTYLLLRAVLAGSDRVQGGRVLDVCTGTGRVALGLAAAGAAEVTAVDISRRAVMTARVNAALNGVQVSARRSDLLACLSDRQFDIIVANPPYVPSQVAVPRGHGRARAWDAGHDGRRLLDRICATAPVHLAVSGELWLVHSVLSDATRTVDMLSAAGLDAGVVARAEIPFGPVMRSRAQWLRARGLITPGQRTEGLVVIRGTVPG